MKNTDIKQRKIPLLVAVSLLSVFSCLLSSGQTFAKNEDLVFKKIYFRGNNTFGIVESIKQDSAGFIWIGSKEGLYRYDGIRYKSYHFDLEDPNSLSNNVVRKIYIDSRNNMWVATENGLNLYNVEKDFFKRFLFVKNDPSTIPSNFVTGIAEDKHGNLWMSTNSGGLCMFDYSTDKFSRIKLERSSSGNIPSDYQNTIYIDNTGIIWIGTGDNGVFFFKPGNPVNYLLPGTKDGKNLFGNSIKCIIGGPDGKMWFGTNGQGISCYDRLKNEFCYYINETKISSSLGSNFISDFFKDSQNRLWICTDGGGLNLFQNASQTFMLYKQNPLDENSISSNVVRTIFEDKSGNYWIGNYNSPIDYIDSHRKKFYTVENIPGCLNCLNGKHINAVLCDSKNKIWIAVDGGGLNVYDPSANKFKIYTHNPENQNTINNDKPLCFAEDKEGNIWVGFFEGGLGCFLRNSGKFVRYFPDGTSKNPRGSQIWNMMIDNETLWLATEKGVDILNLRNKLFTYLPVGSEDKKGTNSSSIWKILKDSNGRILICTLNGLNVYYPDKGIFEYFESDLSNTEGLSDKWVLSIFEDSKHRIWLGTNGGGLNLWMQPENKFKCFTTKNGLSNNVISCIQEDKSGNLWLATNLGLTKFNFDSLSYQVFNANDGLQSNRFNKNSSFKDKNGTLYFGGIKGLTFFNPDSISNNRFIPPVHITGISLFNTEIDMKSAKSPLKENIILQKDICLSDKQSVITIHFAALNYTQSEKNKYRYKLENLDEDWNFIDSEHSVTFTHLKPGKYTFRVTASNNDNIWNPVGTSIRLIITPPLFKTYWFIIFEVFIVILIIIIIYRLRSRNIRATNNKLFKLVNERTFLLEERNKEVIKQNLEMLKQRDLATTQRDQIFRQNEELEIHRNKLTEQVEARTKELMEEKQKADESNKLKTIFLEVISHEIRTPMNAILGFINLLIEKIEEPANRSYYLRILNESGKNLLRLIEDIIDFSRLQTGELQVNIEPCNINEHIKQLVSIYRERASRDKPAINILSEIPEENIVINTDVKKLSQILSHLADNSMKFTDKGFIKIGIKVYTQDSVTFYVEDTGIGIPPENINSLFDRFYNNDHINSDKIVRESGLGLALSKHLTELLGGKIWVESINNSGSIFYFTISCQNTTRFTNIKQHKDAAPMYYWPGKKIIVAEDEDTNFLLIEAIFKETAIEIIHASDGVELLEIVEKNPKVDLVLLDIRMPRLNGLNAIKIVRESLKDVPVIAQTAYDHTFHRQLAFESGCNHFMTKPLRKEELLNLVKTYLG